MPKKKLSEIQGFVSALLSDEKTVATFASLPCEILKTKDGGFYLSYRFNDCPGVVELRYLPVGLAECSTSVAKAAMRATLAAKIKGQPGADEFLNSDKAQEYPTDDEALTLAEIAATVYIKGMAGKLRSLLGELELETECYIKGISSHATGAEIDVGLERLARLMVAERIRFLRGSIARFGAPSWDQMKAHYEELLPLVQDARDVYKANKTRDWQSMIKIGFPQLDNDLIASLSDDDNDLPEYVSKKRNEGSEDDYSKPSDLALEQAARRCGMKPFDLAPRTLSDRVRECATGQTPNGNAAPKKGKTRQRTRKKPAPKKLISRQIH